ncbi:uncharacterized protein CANTADRAFT_35300, partial [Suhomyces tanzawaensis NRRL Y-17324]
MPYTPNIVSTVLFESSEVVVFKIPPGPSKLAKWNLNESNVIWRGSIRLVEQEVIQEETKETRETNDNYDTHIQGELLTSVLENSSTSSTAVDGDHSPDPSPDPSPPHQGLRAKIELFNTQTIPPSVGSLTSVRKDTQWAEVWYNPIDRIASEGIKIANNGQDTVQITESSRYYKIVAQLPQTGYHPRAIDDDDLDLLQIGLGLKFRESYQAISFSESLNLYRRRYRNFEEQYNSDIRALE